MGLFWKKKKKTAIEKPPLPPSFLIKKHEMEIPSLTTKEPKLKTPFDIELTKKTVVKEEKSREELKKETSTEKIKQEKKPLHVSLPKEFPIIKGREIKPQEKPKFEKIKPLSNLVPEIKKPALEPTLESKSELPVIEEPTIKEKPDITEKIITHLKEPVFIEAEEYRIILDHLRTIKTNLSAAEDIAKNLTNLKKNTDTLLQKWKTALLTLEKKLMYIDEKLFKEKLV